jgi:hypothetical protein
MHITYEIIEYNIANDYIIIRPKHPLFKNDPESYGGFSITISELDQSRDISQQLAQRSLSIIESILLEENPDGYSELQKLLLANKEITTPVSELQPTHSTETTHWVTGSSLKVENIDFVS